MRNSIQQEGVGAYLKSHFFIKTDGITLCLYFNAVGTKSLCPLDGLLHHLKSIALVALGGQDTANVPHVSVWIFEDPGISHYCIFTP